LVALADWPFIGTGLAVQQQCFHPWGEPQGELTQKAMLKPGVHVAYPALAQVRVTAFVRSFTIAKENLVYAYA
jgi:hypothetical protein